MAVKIARMTVGLFSVVLLAASGCAKAPPPVVPVSGVLLLDGQPLPQAKIEFLPDIKGFGAEKKSIATTDEQGRFTLANPSTQEPGAVVGRHYVLVSELPTPREFRSQDPAVQARYAEFRAKLKNRPIPADSGLLATALVVEVTAEPKEYRIELKRTQ